MKLLICGTRTKQTNYKATVEYILNGFKNMPLFEITEGCCKGSADEFAEEWAIKNNVKINHFPSTSGNYLKRNIEMIDSKPDLVIAFWDRYSYGTAHTIANAVLNNIKVRVVRLK
jgi:hypothetical protein